MWPWLTSSAGFQPTANFPGIHSSGPQPQTTPTHYVTSQPSIMPGYPTALAHSHTEFPHPHAGMGIRYGVPGIGSVPVDSNLAAQVVHPENATSPGGVVYHPHQQQDEVGGGIVHGIQPMLVVPSNPSAPLVQGGPINQQQHQQQTIHSPLGGGGSLGGGGAIYHQSPSPVVTSPPLSNQPYSSGHHVHNSSPFSVDFILRERPSTETPVGVASSQVVPSYGIMSQSEEEVVKRRSNIPDNFTPGEL